MKSFTFREKILRAMHERQARYAAEKVREMLAEMPASAFDEKCSICGEQFCLLVTFGEFGEQEPGGVIFEGEPVCLGCLDKARAIR